MFDCASVVILMAGVAPVVDCPEALAVRKY